MPSPRVTTWIAVADGGKALVLENRGTDLAPDLAVLSVREMQNPPTREQGTDRPGRYPDPQHHRSAVEDTDWHRFAEERFAAEFAAMLNRAGAAGLFDRLVLIAPPRALGDLRPHLGREVSDRLAVEIDRDLTNHPVPEIAAHVSRALKPGFA